MSNEVEKMTIPEAIGFWQKNKKWIIPTVTAIIGILGGNVDRIPIPTMPTDNESIVSTLDNHEKRISVLEGKPVVDSKKNDDGSQDGGVIKVE